MIDAVAWAAFTGMRRGLTRELAELKRAVAREGIPVGV
jgi:hypothetical protein